MRSLLDKIQDLFSEYLAIVASKIFGKNNEHLDFLMDSFHKLPSRQRELLLGGGFAFIVSMLLLVFSFYFTRVQALDDELNKGFSSLNSLRRNYYNAKIYDSKYESLVNTISKKTRRLSYKPFFEKLSKEEKVSIKSLNVKTVDGIPGDMISDSISEHNIEMKLPKISIPKLLKFMVEIEKSKKFLRVKDIKVTGMYGNKLYFDVELVVRGYLAV